MRVTRVFYSRAENLREEKTVPQQSCVNSLGSRVRVLSSASPALALLLGFILVILGSFGGV
jgi:hypothetical protein